MTIDTQQTQVKPKNEEQQGQPKKNSLHRKLDQTVHKRKQTNNCKLEIDENGNEIDEGHSEPDCPPPMPITISFGTSPGCSGWQIIKKRDPTMTFDEQLAREYAKMVWDYRCYWYRKSMDVTSSDSSSESFCSMPSYESFIDNAPPGLPKGKESASGRVRPKKGKRSASPQPSKT